MIPGIGFAFDGTNALWYLAAGDIVNAGLSGTALIPVVGEVAGGGKIGARVVSKAIGKSVKYSDKMVEATEIAVKSEDKIADDVGKSGSKVDFYVTPKGDEIPCTRAEFDNNLSVLENKNEKYIGETSSGVVRIRVEEAHLPTPGYSAEGGIDHLVDHVHIEYKQNGATGRWGKGIGNKISIPQSWLE